MKTLFIGDAHFPWASADALTGVYSLIVRHGPFDKIIQLGDLYDLFAYSKFPKVPTITPSMELHDSRASAEEFWRRLVLLNETQHRSKKKKRLIPRHQAYWQIMGNHDIRPYKRMEEKLPELEPFTDFLSIYRFKDVNLHSDYREPLKVDDQLVCHHGWKSKLGAHLSEFKMNCVIGHTHRPGIHIEPCQNFTPKWEMNAGFIADPLSKALSYTATKWTKWSHAVGLVDEDGPRIILL